MNSARRWLNNTQPQTLQIAVMLLYLNAAFFALSVLMFGLSSIALALIVGQAAGAYGIANERKWGYILAVVAAVLPLALLFTRGGGIFRGGLLTLMFEVALVALLVHPQSREYQRIWFK